MTTDGLKKLAQEIVNQAQQLNIAYTTEHNAPVNYACVFSQSEYEYEELIHTASQFGSIVQETKTGPVFQIPPIQTVAGTLKLLKIRHPDPKRTERGDADFTVSDYPSFKKKYLGTTGFGIIERPEMEMMELIDPSYNVLAYYSYPTLAKVLKIDL
jgi:hypothetical protein